MRRKYNAEQVVLIVDDLRKAMPDAMISVDAIAGFPGESIDNFMESVERLRKIRPLHIHSFPYSKRAGTEAASMYGQIPEDEKKRRNRVLCDLSRDINIMLLNEYVKEHSVSPVTVLCESADDSTVTGHTEHFVEVRFPGTPEDVGKTLKIRTSVVDTKEKTPFVKGIRL
jgi:threonylcarbamoyladenosine tRNA methylthiotransferase MtaB